MSKKPSHDYKGIIKKELLGKELHKSELVNLILKEYGWPKTSFRTVLINNIDQLIRSGDINKKGRDTIRLASTGEQAKHVELKGLIGALENSSIEQKTIVLRKLTRFHDLSIDSDVVASKDDVKMLFYLFKDSDVINFRKDLLRCLRYVLAKNDVKAGEDNDVFEYFSKNINLFKDILNTAQSSEEKSEVIYLLTGLKSYSSANCILDVVEKIPDEEYKGNLKESIDVYFRRNIDDKLRKNILNRISKTSDGKLKERYKQIFHNS